MNKEALRSVGAELKQKRLELGLSIEEISSKLRIKSSYIKALEAGEANSLSRGTYTIGNIKRYAEFLRLDTDGYLEEIKSGARIKLSAISSENLITGEEFLPSKTILICCIVSLALVYWFSNS